MMRRQTFLNVFSKLTIKINFVEQELSSQLMGHLSIERERNEILQKQLDSISFLSKRKVSKPKLHDTPASTSIQMPTISVSKSDNAVPTTGEEQVEAKKDPQPVKVTKRVAPASHRQVGLQYLIKGIFLRTVLS